MPLESWPQPDMPMPNDEAVIWRYFRFKRFADLIQSSELYFCRSDVFDDKHEGLPTDEYIERICRNEPQQKFNHLKGVLEQAKESHFASCWYNFDAECAKMWVKYGRDGVAVVSRFGKLKAVLDLLPDK
jgi:hypothetical protein